MTSWPVASVAVLELIDSTNRKGMISLTVGSGNHCNTSLYDLTTGQSTRIVTRAVINIEPLTRGRLGMVSTSNIYPSMASVNHLNPVMLVFIGKRSLSTLR